MPQSVLDTIETHRITNFTATPTMLARIADVPGVDDRDLSSVEWILQGAAVMPADSAAPMVRAAEPASRS